jgi:hypothetical protein
MFSFFTKPEQTENEKKLIKQLEEALTENSILKLQIEELLKDKFSTEDKFKFLEENIKRYRFDAEVYRDLVYMGSINSKLEDEIEEEINQEYKK